MNNYIKRGLITAGTPLLRRHPSFPGRYRFSSLLLSWLRDIGSTMGSSIVQTRFDFKFKCDLADWLGQYVYLNGVYEPPTAAAIAMLIKPGDTMIDVGANAGFFSLMGASLVGEGGRVLSFEPIPSVREILATNIKLNGYDNIDVFPVALSNQTAVVKIYEGPIGHKGISSLRPIPSHSGQIEINAIALDDMTDRINTVSLIKIDVEGAELLALTGMEKLVRRDHPSFIIEFTDKYLQSFGHSAKQLAGWLESHGYKLYRINDDGLFPLDIDAPDLPGQYNVLACQSLPTPLAASVRVHDLAPNAASINFA